VVSSKKFKDLVVFFGAGVGVPAGLPTAAQLVEAIADAFVTDPEWVERITALIQPAGPLRFETAMDELTETADPRLEVLEFLDWVAPGPLHEGLAWVGLQGARLVTTNHDDVVERALAARGARPWTVDAHQKTSRGPRRAVEVLKLHGTRRVHGKSGPRFSDLPLHATISEIVRLGGGISLPPRAHDLLASALAGKRLLIIGYSGSDDLDVMPSLARCRPAAVTWVHHTREAGVDPDEMGTEGARRLLERWRRAGVEVRTVAGDTEAFLVEQGWELPPPLGEEERAQRVRVWRDGLPEWAERARLEDPSGLGWAAFLCASLGLGEERMQAIEQSVPSPKPKGAWSEQRRLYELALCLLSLDAEEAIACAEEARRKSIANEDPEVTANSEVMIARGLSAQERYEEADAALARARSTLDSVSEELSHYLSWSRANLAFWTGRFRLLQGEFEAARKSAREAADIFAQEGNMISLSEALQIVGQVSWAEFDTPAAVEPLDRAIDFARKGPYPGALTLALMRRAHVAYYNAELEACCEYARESVELYFAAGETDGVAEAISPWGNAANELGWFDEAKGVLEHALLCLTESENQFWGPDIVLGLADSLFHLGEVEAALAILDEEAEVVERYSWDIAHAETIRWRAGIRTADQVDAAIAHALDDDPKPLPRPTLCLLRLHVSGPASEELLRYAEGVLANPRFHRRRDRLHSWLDGD
jgi:tetratricopeptide (TPR) repeat protein